MPNNSVLSRIKNVELVRNQVRAAEQSGRSPERTAYRDHKDIPTIATGFNLTRPDASSICQSLGINFEATLAGAPLTVKQAQDLEDHVICETAQICINKLGQQHFDKLAPEQQASVISVALTPAMLGQSLTTYIRTGAYTSAADEIQYRSNRSKHVGMQNRRDREAELFRSAIPCAASPSAPTASSSSIPPPLSGGSVPFFQSVRQVLPSIPTDLEVIGNFIGKFIQDHVRVGFDIPRPPAYTRGQLEILDGIKCFQDLQQALIDCGKAIKKGKTPNLSKFEKAYQRCHAVIIEQGNCSHCYDSSTFNPYVDEVSRYGADFCAAFYGKKIVSQSERLDTIDEYKRALDDLLTLNELKKAPPRPIQPLPPTVTASASVAASSSRDDKNARIDTLSALFETSGRHHDNCDGKCCRPGACHISSGYLDRGKTKKDPRGKSYGRHQLASAPEIGTLQKFLHENPVIERDFAGLAIGSDVFDRKWIEMSHQDNFVKAQDKFIIKTNFTPVRTTANAVHLLNTEIIDQILYSCGVQHGPDGANQIVRNAAQELASIGKLNDEQMTILCLYKHRAVYIDGIPDSAINPEGKATLKQNRCVEEREVALKMFAEKQAPALERPPAVVAQGLFRSQQDGEGAKKEVAPASSALAPAVDATPTSR